MIVNSLCMYLIFLILSLGVLLFVEYYFLFKNEIATPAISFTLGLFICAIILSTFIDLWDVHLHQETYWLIIGGSICVALGSLGGDILSKKKKEENRGGQFIPISVRRLKFILFIQIFAAVIQVLFLFKYYGGRSLAENLVAHTMAIKFGDDSMVIPFKLGFILGLSYNLGFMFAFLLPLYMTKGYEYSRERFWLSVNFVLCLFFSLLTSGRSPMLWMLITFGTFYFIHLNLNKMRLNLKRLLLWGICGYIFLMSFQQLGFLIGREKTAETATYVIGVYCGAEIQNLDDYIRGPIEKMDYWGEMTFYQFLSTLEKDWGVVHLRTDREKLLPFNYRGGYGLGNVATAFQAYYVDFRFKGTMIVCFVIGLIMQLLYKRVKMGNSIKNGVMNWTSYLYSLILPSMFMSFFAESFYIVLMNILGFRFWIGYILLFLLFYGKFPWKKN